MNTLRRLGKTDIYVTPVGLGLLQFSQGWIFFRYSYRKLPADTMNNIVKAAIEGQINWFDTAEIYGLGRSERSLARGLKSANGDKFNIVIATKWFPLFRTAKNIPKTIDTRLKWLEGNRIDLYQVHLPYSFSSDEEIMNKMTDILEQGKIRSIGVSNYSDKKMRKAFSALSERGVPLASNQVHYSLLNRKIESNGILNTAKELGITVIAYCPLESGLLSGKFHSNHNVLDSTPFHRRNQLKTKLDNSRSVINLLREIGKIHNATPAQVALNWLINFHGETVVAIPGASAVNQVRDNAGAMNIILSTGEMDELDIISRKFRFA
jgi:aryl-alcohol dehydrogenase-like predicted oxidoreductase